VRPALSLFSQSLYVGTSGPAQTAAFWAALERRPDAIFVHRLDAMCPLLLTRKHIVARIQSTMGEEKTVWT